MAEAVRPTRANPRWVEAEDPGEYPTSTIESKEAFFAEGDPDAPAK